MTYDDYAQSANTLFHFMKKLEYLEEILEKKAIIPRYCKEDLEYLNVKNEKSSFIEVFVLQKCFCDIPFHKLTENFKLQATGDNYLNLSEQEQLRVKNNKYTHPDFYGEYAIAFSKGWGEKNNLQPVHYLNEYSQYTQNLSNLINQTINLDDVPEVYANDVLIRLGFVKPLRGVMKRKFKRDDGTDMEIEFQKNFHDEQEWRYVPSIDVASGLQKDIVIANPYLLGINEKGVDISAGLNDEKYHSLWLKYSYEDVRYIIVPDGNARIDIINTIMSISDSQFRNQSDVAVQKHILISKILVLEEIRKDW